MNLLYRLYGFGHALAFVKINEKHIDGAEKFIRENVHEHLKRTTIDALNESGQDISMDDENVLISKDRLVEYFGELYATQPQNFRFAVGDRILIEELVEHVKDIVTNQGKKGLKIYKCQKQKKEKKIGSKLSISENDHNKLKSQLLKRVISSMYSHEAELFFDADLNSIVNENAVDVRIKKEVGIFGSVRCLICDIDGKKKSKPKQVHYSTSSDWPCWVLENFNKHLRTVHKLQYNKSRKQKQEKKVKTRKPKQEDILQDDIAENEQINNSKANDKDQSVQFVCEEKIEVCAADAKFNGSIEAVKKSIYSQLSEQINAILSATLHNSEMQESVSFFIDDICHSFTVATIDPDGNCLFGSIAHQLYRLKINSRPHKKKTAELRANVVTHILQPDNFPNYAYQLQDCVYRSMKKEDIKDMTTECKLYVKLILSKKGMWAGAESIRAISDLEEVNIIIINEDGPCYKLSNLKKTYEKSVCIAFRLAQKNDQTRIHYDSVCDVDSNILNLMAQEIEKQTKD